MAYKHGIYGREVPTQLTTMAEASAGLPVVFGTAPVHLATDRVDANTPVLCYSYSDAVGALGYSDDWEKYTLCEFMKSHYALFNMAPVVFINVLDPTKHKKTISLTDGVTISADKTVIINDPVLLETLKVKIASAGEPLKLNIDYTAAHNDAGSVVITCLADGALATADKLFYDCDVLDPSLVTADDVVGGIGTDGTKKGLELVSDIYPRFRLVPGNIVAPHWSENTTVTAVMKAKTTNINGMFEAMAVADVPADVVKKYQDVPAWINEKNYIDPRLIVCWPQVSLGGVKYHLSTQACGIISKTDGSNDDVPYASPSNKSLQCDSAITAEKEVFLGVDEAAYINGQGITTALNFNGGWKLWGNRTSAYPSSQDVKDTFIPIRRMFNWVNNTLILSFWAKVDDPMNKPFIRNIVNSANIWLNGLTAANMLLGGRVEFRQDENPTTDLMNGICKFHVYFAPPSPAEDIEFIQEYDTNYISGLFDTTR